MGTVSATFGRPRISGRHPGFTGEGDADADGASDRSEWTAGTNPRDAAEVLRLTTPEALPNGTIQFHWPTRPGRQYTLEVANGLDAWAPASSSGRGTGDPMVVTCRRWIRGFPTFSGWSLLPREGFGKTLASGLPRRDSVPSADLPEPPHPPCLNPPSRPSSTWAWTSAAPKILAGVFTSQLKLLQTAKLSTKADRGFDAVLDRIDRCVRDAGRGGRGASKQVRAVGIGAPGAVNPENGEVIFPTWNGGTPR